MLANSLFVSTERPPQVNDIKRALLAYDQVYFYAPDNRDVIPAHFFFQVSGSPIPFALAPGPIRPLGKVAGYDDAFSQTMETCKPAIEQNIIKILDTPESLERRLVLGMPEPPKDYFPPDLTYHGYRTLATKPEFINVVSRGLDEVSSNAKNQPEELAPKGLDEDSINLFDQVEVLGSQPKSLYAGFAASDEEREVMGRLCLARLAATVKSLGTCEKLGLQPYTLDPGIAGAIQQINHSARHFFQTQEVPNEERQVQNRLSQLHRVIISEYLDDALLNEMAIRDVLKMRSQSWGRARENRVALEKSLSDIALDDMSSEQFERACKQVIDQYLKATFDWQHEADKLKVNIMCSIGQLVLGTAGGTSEFLQKLTGLPTWTAILVIGAFAWGTARANIPALMDVLKHRAEADLLPGYALTRPYGTFFKPSR